MIKQMTTWMKTADFVSLRQTNPSQMEAPKIAGMEIAYWNNTRRLLMKSAIPIPAKSMAAIAIRPMAK